MMIKFTILSLIAILSISCARLHSITRDPVLVINTNNVAGSVIAYRETKVTAVTFFDSQSALTKFQNRGQLTTSNEWASGTSIGQLNQSASSTNLNELLGIVVQAAVQGAAKSVKP